MRPADPKSPLKPEKKSSVVKTLREEISLKQFSSDILRQPSAVYFLIILICAFFS